MRLYLSSYKYGNYPNRLVDMVSNNKRVAMIANAQDYKTSEERAAKVAIELKELHDLGFDPFELDLRHFFDKSFNPESLKNCGLVWVRGGNVFVLRLAMKMSGFDDYLLKALNEDSFVYGGFSAGGCVLSPSLEGFDIVDDTAMTQLAYGKDADYSALGILKYHFEPHYKSDHPESADVDKEIDKLKATGIPYKALHDGEVIIVNGDKEELIN